MHVLGGFLLLTVTLTEVGFAYLQSTCGEGISIHDNEEYGFALNGYTYRALTTASYAKCWLQCEDDSNCMSLNYDMTTQQCHLNSQNKISQPTKYVMKHNSYYKTIANRKPKEKPFRIFPICPTLKPCGNNARCIDGKGNYTCQCPDRIVGYTCEIALDNCYSQPCQHGGHCVNLVNDFYCTCPVGYGGKTCWKQSGFNVVNKVAVTYNNEEYLAIEASLAPSGLSVNSSWCEDYYWLCEKYDARPVGCGRSYDNLTGVAKCRDDYKAILQTGDPIGCASTDHVAAVVIAAGLNATRKNSFAFGSCDQTCPRQLLASECVGSLPCLKLTPDLKVFTFCSKFSDSAFVVREEKDLFYYNTTYKFLQLQITSPTSRHENWCRDYQRLCESYALRPVAFSKQYEYDFYYWTPGREYHAVVEPDLRFTSYGHDRINTLAKLVGFQSATTNTFTIRVAFGSYICKNTVPSSGSSSNLYYMSYGIRHKMFTACSDGGSLSLFRVLSYRNITFQNTHFLALKTKVQTQVNRQNWCKEYQSLCESFNLQPVGCSADYKYVENTQCRDVYRSMVSKRDVFGCPPYDKATEVVNLAGFSDANINNTFVFHECDQCTGNIPNDCSSGFVQVPCIGARLSNQVAYTLCSEADGAFSVLSSYSTSRENVPLLTLHVRHMTAVSKYDNWCTEYKELCGLYSLLPTGCGTAMTDAEYVDCNVTYSSYRPSDNILGCPPAAEIQKIALSSGYTGVQQSYCFGFSRCLSYCTNTLTNTPSISLPSLDYNAHPKREAYTVCQGPPPSFGGVLETNTTVYNNQKYHVMKLKLPTNGKSLQKNWCKEYQMLCKYYGLRPTGCGKSRIEDEGVRVCRDDYDSIIPQADDLGCDPRRKVSEIAKQAGFADATTYNSFAFYNCSDCPRILPSSGCTGGLYCLNTAITGHVYTVCRGSDSNFIVRDTATVEARGTNFLVLKTEVPKSYQSKHETWCADYKNLCASYGKLPTGLSENSLLTNAYYSNCKSKYQSVMLRERFQVTGTHDVDDLVKHSNIRTSTSISYNFAFYDCRTGYCVKTMKSSSHLSLPSLLTKYRIFQTICVNPDCNFGLIDTRNYTYYNRHYVVVHATVPKDGVAKYDNWCRDYQRLCQSFNRIPVTCGKDSWRKKDSYLCRDEYGATLFDKHALSCDNSDAVAIARGAGFQKASNSNTLTFHNCRKCSKYLRDVPSEALHPLSRSTRDIYAICTDSNSNFEVLETKLIEHKGISHTAIMCRTPDDGYSRHENWCRDYERLCATYGQQPTGCGIYYQSNPAIKSCEIIYNSSMPITNIFGCPPTNEMQKAISGVFATSTTQDTFGFYSCDGSACSNLLPNSGTLNSLKYASRITSQSLKHTVCVERRPAFEYLSHQEARKQDISFLVIKVKLPTDGKSRFENWCRDYEKLCSMFARRPLACPTSSLNNSKNRLCRDEYNAVMPSDSMFGCGPNRTALAEIAHSAGYLNATKNNIFAMRECNSCNDTIPSAAHINSNLYDIRLGVPNNEAYTICVHSDSNFRVFQTKPVVYGGWKYLAVKAQIPQDRTAQHLNWCRDYQRMCESFGKRPLAPDTAMETYTASLDCKLTYNAYFPDSQTIWSQIPYNPHIMNAVKKAETSIPNQFAAFAFSKCGTHCDKLLQGSNCQTALQCLSRQSLQNNVGYTLCSDPDSGFKDPLTRTVVYKGIEYLVIMASVQTGSKSRHLDWCKDYQKMCESYGRRPLGCGVAYHRRNHLRCRDRYNALMFYNDTSHCNQNERVADIAKHAGFILANENNSFAFNSCEKSDCPQTFGTRSTRAFYNAGTDPSDPNIFTVCVNSDSNFDVVLTKSKNEHLVVKARIPEDGVSKYETWCHDYERLCASYGLRPATSDYTFLKLSYVTSCRTNYNAYISRTKYIKSPPQSEIDTIVSTWSNTASPKNSFAFYKCNEEDCINKLPASGCSSSLSCISQSVPNRMVHTICTEPTAFTNFKVLDTRKSKFMNGEFLVIKSIINDASGASKGSNWCEDYRALCDSYGKRPLACPLSRATGHSYHRCGEKFNAVLMELNECPLNRLVTHMAHSVGFLQATESNSFAFKSCNESTCVKYLNGTGCDDALYCISRTVPYGEVYTVCVNSQTNFEVIDTTWATVNSIKYLAIKARLPIHGKPLQHNWCREYQVLCESYNARPMGCADSSLVDPDSQSCAINYNVGDCSSRESVKTMITGYQFGYTTATVNDTFVFSSCSHAACSQDLTTSTCHNSLDCIYKNLLGKEMYTMCRETKVQAFDVLQTKRYVHQGIPYLVFKTRIPSSPNSKTVSWCKDYQMLCNSYGLKPTGCGMMRANDTDYSLCSSVYGSIMLPGNNLGCDPRSMVSLIARKAGFYNATPDNSFGFHRCGQGGCSSRLPSTGCSPSLSCLSVESRHLEFYTLCTSTQRSNFEVIDTSYVLHMGMRFLTLRARLPTNATSLNDNWCEDYQRLCEDYDGRPVGCGAPHSQNPDMLLCEKEYDSFASNADLFGCGSTRSAAEIIQKGTLKGITYDNVFIFHRCNKKSCTKKYPTSGCSKSLHCLKKNILPYEAFTLCLANEQYHNFEVMKSKRTIHNNWEYEAFEVKIPKSKKSRNEDWCRDYQRLCETNGMRPVGCNITANSSNPNCQRYNQLTTSDENPCSSTEFAKSIANKAGFSTATTLNSFTFDDCSTEKCPKNLDDHICQSEPQSSFCKLNSLDLAYTICVKANTTFEVHETRNVAHKGLTFDIIKAKAPTVEDTQTKNWCMEYEKVCKSYGLRTVVAKNIIDEHEMDSLACQENYNAISIDFGQDRYPYKLANVAGFTNASKINSFTLSRCTNNSCNGTFDHNLCGTAFNCLKDKATHFNFVYFVCLKHVSPSNFEVVATKDIQYHDEVHLVVQARLPFNGRSQHENWCRDYQKLCENYGLRPLSCNRDKYDTDNDKALCLANYDAVMPIDSSLECPAKSRVKKLANLAGFTKATMNNSFALFSCTTCSNILDSSVPNQGLSGLLLNKDRVVYTVCTKDQSYNFEVLETRLTTKKNTEFLVVRLNVPRHVTHSKQLNWCKDYQMMCESYGRRPFGHAANSLIDGGDECEQLYNAYMVPDDAFKVNAYSKFPEDVESLVNSVGFEKASYDNNNIFVFFKCIHCKKSFDNMVSDVDYGVSYLGHANSLIEKYTVCA